jgi:signal transduction histidine kinase
MDPGTLDRFNAGVFSVDAELRIVHWNQFMATNSGRSSDDVVGRDLFACFPELPEPWLRWKLRSVFLLGTFAFSSWKQRPYVFRFPHNRPLTGGTEFMYQDVAFVPSTAGGGVDAVCVLITDATDAALSHRALDDAHRQLAREMAERERIQDELRIAHKLEAVGQLAAGIAHEINTPIQYVADSVNFIGEAFADLRAILDLYRRSARDGTQPPSAHDDPELTYLEEHVPAAVERALTGLDRMANLVRAMKEFGQPARGDKRPGDVNRAIDTTLTVASSAYREVAEIALELGDLPEVPCHISELSQVFLQLIVNAAHAIGDVHRPPAKGVIRIRSWSDPSAIHVSVSDNGTGIPEAIRDRIFDPFFTTKPVGRGTGQGLSIARSIVVDRHAGSLTFDTAIGAGTTFVVRIPR